MKQLLLFFTVGLFTISNAQNLATNKIDENLMKGANVVIRKSITTFEVINEGKATKTFHLELTILNSLGKREATQYVSYDDLQKVISYSGEIYDKEGKLAKKLKRNTIKDISAGGSNMYSDDRLKVLEFDYPSYPYSIVFDYKIQYDGLMFYPSWFPQDHTKTAVEYASLIVSIPSSIGLNFFENKVNGYSIKDNNNIVYNWAINNIRGFDPEPYGPPIRELLPFVLLTPKSFKMKGYSGSMSSWESIGLYENELLKGKDNLPPEAIRELEELIDGIVDNREKAKQIYEFVQNTTRYVSVQLGIGGWQPYDATYVYKNGYGDCKALSNYTYALLKQAGIHSIYTNVYAGQGEPDIITAFPNSRFNHIILAVPFEKDTVWLECTSQTKPFGYTGYFTSDRHVLLITDKGGKLVKTPAYTKNENTQERVLKINIDKVGDASALIKTEFSGLQYENVNNQIYKSPQEQKKWLLKKIDLDKTAITSFKYEHNPGIVPKITETIEVSSRGYGSVSGTRIFFEANPLNQLTQIPKKVKDRKTATHINIAYTDIDSIYFSLPEGYHVEYLPKNKHIKNQFGEYQVTYKLTDNGLLYVRKMVREKGIFPAESYEEHRDMLKEIARTDKTKVVLVGST